VVEKKFSKSSLVLGVAAGWRRRLWEVDLEVWGRLGLRVCYMSGPARGYAVTMTITVMLALQSEFTLELIFKIMDIEGHVYLDRYIYVP
jgi:hypothetical protein